MASSNDDSDQRVELTPRQVADIQGYLDTHGSKQATTDERSDAAGMLVGYMRSAFNRKS